MLTSARKSRITVPQTQFARIWLVPSDASTGIPAILPAAWDSVWTPLVKSVKVRMD